MDSIQKLIADFPDLFESEKTEDNYKFKHFIITFIQHFMEQLDLISLTVDREIDDRGNLVEYRKANIMRACSSAAKSLPKTGLPFEGLVKNLLKTGLQQLADNFGREKMNQIVDRITPGSLETNEAIVMVACEIARMYEEQIIKLSAKNNYKYCKILAKDIASGILQYIPEEKCEPLRGSVNLAKFCLQWVEKPEFANKYWYLKSEGEILSIEGFKDEIKSKELLSKTGIAVADGNNYKYYDLKSDNEYAKHGSLLLRFFEHNSSVSKNFNDVSNTNYGFRLLSIFESSSSVCKNLNDITKTIDTNNLYQYQSTLQSYKSSELLHKFAGDILKLMTQTEKDLIMQAMQEMGTNIQTLKEQMVQENQTQTANVINAFKEIVEHLQPAGTDSSYQKSVLQKLDNIMDEIQKSGKMVSHSHQQATNVFNISGSVTIQNSNNAQGSPDQPTLSTTTTSRDQTDATNSNSIAKTQTKDIWQKQVSSGMLKEHAELLRRHRMDLIEGCEYDVKRICEYLFGKKILTSYHKQTILAMPTSFEQMTKLLDILPRRGNLAFDEFCNTLEKCEIKIPGFYE